MAKTKKIRTTKKNLKSVNFRCEKCGDMFHCGSDSKLAWERLCARVRKHMMDGCYTHVTAVNPPIGMVYVNVEHIPYKGGDVEEWHEKVRAAMGMIPSFNTVKV